MSLYLIYIIIAVAVLAVGTSLYFYAFRYEPSNFKLSNIDIFLRQLGKSSKDRKDRPFINILHLSDFHLRKNRKGEKLFKFVQSLKDKNPDFIFITGDMIEQDENIGYLIKMLKPLKAKYGKYAVFGVHDYYDKAVSEFLKNMVKRKKAYNRKNNVGKLISKLSGIGIKVLRNEMDTFENNDRDIQEIDIVGIDDPILEKADVSMAIEGKKSSPMAKKERNKFYKEKFGEFFKNGNKGFHILREERRLRLALVHTPDTNTIINLVQNDTDIIFSGHTHGGQIRLPLIGALMSGCRLKTKFASGLFYFKKFVLYVSRGLSEGRYSQFRFFCRPEATMIRIYKK